jgi:hypothetical protein
MLKNCIRWKLKTLEVVKIRKRLHNVTACEKHETATYIFAVFAEAKQQSVDYLTKHLHKHTTDAIRNDNN